MQFSSCFPNFLTKKHIFYLTFVFALKRFIFSIKLGVPVDTPEVQHAKAAHFAAVAKAGGHAHGHYDHAPYYHGDDGSYKPDVNGY